jgi:hypothetical protein
MDRIVRLRDGHLVGDERSAHAGATRRPTGAPAIQAPADGEADLVAV